MTDHYNPNLRDKNSMYSSYLRPRKPLPPPTVKEIAFYVVLVALVLFLL